MKRKVKSAFHLNAAENLDGFDGMFIPSVA